MTIWMLMGKIAPGFEWKSVPMMNAKTARTTQMRNEMITRKSTRVRGLTTVPAISPIDRPRLRRLITRAEKSWAAPMKIVPSPTHKRAGTQPQITAMAGPTIGAAPAIDAKWWPHSTCSRVGT